MLEEGAQAGTGEPRRSTQLTDGQLKKCGSGASKIGIMVTERTKYLIYIRGTAYSRLCIDQ